MSTAVRGRPRRARAHGALDRHRCWVMCWVYLYVTGTARTSTTRNAEKLLIYLPTKRQRPSTETNACRPSQTAEPDTQRLRADVAPGAGGGDPHRPGFRDERISEFGNIYQNAEFGSARGEGLAYRARLRQRVSSRLLSPQRPHPRATTRWVQERRAPEGAAQKAHVLTASLFRWPAPPCG